MALSPEQRSGLWQAKLRALALTHLGRVEGVDHEVPWGAAFEHQGEWTVLLEVAPDRSLGQALVLASKNDAVSLDLLVDSDAAGAVARRAALFEPEPVVWAVDASPTAANQLIRAIPSPIESHQTEPLAPHVEALLQLDDIRVVHEQGQTIAECRGLEVARVQGVGADQRLQVGVGAYDQGAFAVMHPNLTPNEALAEVVAQVLIHRRRGAGPHPLNRLVRERWLRSELLDDPSRIGLVSLEPVEPVAERDGLKDVVAAPALGLDTDGARVLVICSVGIDLDAVPAAVDLAEHHKAVRIVMVLPERDHHPLVQSVAARSRRPIGLVVADEPWS